MTTDDKIRDENLQYDINIEAAKISALLSGKIDKYEYLTGEEILPSNRRQIKQANFTYSSLAKALEKQTEKQVSALNLYGKLDVFKKIEDIFPKNLLTDLSTNKALEIIKLQNSIKLRDLEYTAKVGHFVFIKETQDGDLSLENADAEQSRLFNELKKYG